MAGDAGVEEDEDAAVFERADEATEALLECEDGFRDLIVKERTAAGFLDGAHAGLDDRIGGNGEGQAINDDATEGFALDVDSLPEAGGAEENGVWGGAEFLEEGFARGGAVEEKREIEDRQEALVEGAHLGVTGEKAERAAAGDVENALDGCGCGSDKVGFARVGHRWREIEESLLAIAEVRRNDELASVGEAETAADVLEAALDGKRGGGENDGGDLFEDEGAKKLGDVDGRGLKKCSAGTAASTTAGTTAWGGLLEF